MRWPDYEKAKKVAKSWLENGLSADLRYHSTAHTFEEVLPAVERIAEIEGISGEDLLLLRTAAVFHDLGFLEQSEDHEAISARLAGEILPQFGYTTARVEAIQVLILATRPPPSPKSRFEEILVDADLDILGRENYLDRIEDLRFELAAQGTVFNDEEWYRNQLDFLKTHTYWTASAKALRDKGKRKNIRHLVELLENQRGK